MTANNLTAVAVKFGKLIPANIELKLSEDNLANDLLNTTAPICWSCRNLCREAYTTSHPCTLCVACKEKQLAKIQEKEEDIECPCTATCENLNLSVSDLQNVNHLYRKKFDAVEFFCPNKNAGCLLQFTSDQIEKHVKENCDFEIKECRFCKEHILKHLLEEHENNNCEQRIVKCELCDKDVSFSSHKDIKNENCCKNFFDTCPYCNDVNLTRDEFVKHLESCKAKPRFCSFKETGCDFFNTDVLVKEHEEVNQLHHQMCMMKKINQLAIRNEELSKKVAQLTDGYKQCMTILLELVEKCEIEKVKVENNMWLWIVEDIDEKKECVESTKSPIFYMENILGYEYEVMVFLRLKRRESSMNNHISLHMRIIKGEDDEDLEWPCPLTFTLEVVKLTSFNDLSPASIQISWENVPDMLKSCFEKPKTEINSQIGNSKILTHEEAFPDSGDYMKNDKMVIRITAYE